VLWVENVGNLVCPAGFTAGEHCKLALLRVTEAEEKPLKYLVMFHMVMFHGADWVMDQQN